MIRRDSRRCEGGHGWPFPATGDWQTFFPNYGIRGHARAGYFKMCRRERVPPAPRVVLGQTLFLAPHAQPKRRTTDVHACYTRNA